MRCATTVEPGQGVLSAAIVAWGCDDVSASIPGLICLEMVEGFRAAPRHGTSVSVMWIEAVVNVAMEVVRAVEPGPAPMNTPPLHHSGP